MRVQLASTANISSADEALMESCDALKEICKHVKDTIIKRHKGDGQTVKLE